MFTLSGILEEQNIVQESTITEKVDNNLDEEELIVVNSIENIKLDNLLQSLKKIQ
ncbi:33697_t:CDS:2 [Gigaspora margarita]|uniref:33697_t:CDS:1 n=1 Tax=Gigaspora margarita TaxID=4874 RepID=A0ABN7UX30_GIGMA|nr:33697_t:CDS:2 [Gigaspora margarita]